MRWFTIVRTVLLLLALVLPLIAAAAPVAAQSLIGSNKDCGTYRFAGDLVKGRTDSMVAKVDHTEGCYRYQFMTHIGTSMTESYGYAGQQAMCERAGREAAVGHFKWYRGIDIRPESVRVSCTPWAGGD